MLQQVKRISLLVLTTIFLIITLIHGFSYHDKLLSASAEVYDGRIGIVLDEVERTDTYPSGFSEIPPLAQGHDYCVIYFTINQINVGHVFVLSTAMGDHTKLLDSGDQDYDLENYLYRGINFRDIHDITSEAEFIEGTEGIFVFQIPIQAIPLTLKLAYFYGASWNDYSSPISAQVDITLTQPLPFEQNVIELTGDNRANAPVNLGNVVTGGDQMALVMDFPAYEAAVDIYAAVQLPDGSLYVVNSEKSLTTELVPYARNVTAAQSETILESFDVCTASGALVPTGTWWVYSVVAPTNGGDFSAIDFTSGAYDLRFYSFDVTCP